MVDVDEVQVNNKTDKALAYPTKGLARDRHTPPEQSSECPKHMHSDSIAKTLNASAVT
jgi:hypothetical protein